MWDEDRDPFRVSKLDGEDSLFFLSHCPDDLVLIQKGKDYDFLPRSF